MKKNAKFKMNNKGFSLLEVLIAMIILAIVSVPLLRSFATGAQTNAKAKIKMKATTAAENIMEDVKTMTTEEIFAKVDEYSSSENENESEYDEDADNPVIKLTIRDNDEMSSDLPDGYYAVVTLDPNNDGTDGRGAYPNANGLNIAGYEPISVNDCAIFTMKEAYDEPAYEEFMNRNAAYIAKYGKPATEAKTKEYFEENLERIIRVYIEDGGSTYTDKDGNTKNTIRAKLQVEYKCDLNIVDGDDQRKFVITDAYFFDNNDSHKELNGIYLFFYPRYKAAKKGKETIYVNNAQNVDTDLYVTAIKRPLVSEVPPMCYQKDEEGKDKKICNHVDHERPTERAEYYQYAYQKIHIVENMDRNCEKAHIRLRTNLLSTDSTTQLRTPYSKGDSYTGYGLATRVIYEGTNGNSGEVYGAASGANVKAISKQLSIADIDGKNLDKDSADIRIYNLNVAIFDGNDNQVVELDGTKLKQY